MKEGSGGATWMALALVGCAHAAGSGKAEGVPTIDAGQCTETVASPAPGEARANGRERFGAVFVPGGAEFLFLSTQTGVPQLYLASTERPEERPTQLSLDAAGIPVWLGGRPVMVPGGRHALFQCGPFEFCKVGLDAPHSVERHAGPHGSTYQFGPFAARDLKDRYFIEGRQRDEPGLHIFSFGFGAGGDTQLVYSDPSIRGWLRGISPDGRRALVLDLRSHDDWALVVVDLPRRVARRVHPMPGTRAKVSSVVFSEDGRTVYLGTDEGQDKATILALDAESGAEISRYEERTYRTAEVVALAVSPDGNRLAATLSAGNVDRLRILDARTLALLPPSEPLRQAGQGAALGFQGGSTRLAAEWSTPGHPRDLYLVDLERGSVEPLIPGGRAGPSWPAVEASVSNIESFDGVELATNVYLPQAPPGTRHPVAVHLSCGPGDTAKLERSALVTFLLGEGFAVVQPNLRGAAGFGRSFAQLDDGRRRVDVFEDLGAVRQWVAAQPWADPRSIVVAGASYSGYLALMGLARQPGGWRAGIDLYGITDWRSFFQSSNAATAAVYAREVETPDVDGEFLTAISPMGSIASVTAPVFVYHGKDDRQVPVSQSQTLVEALRQRGVPVVSLLVEGEGHGMQKASTKKEFHERLRCFLRQALQR